MRGGQALTSDKGITFWCARSQYLDFYANKSLQTGGIKRATSSMLAFPGDLSSFPEAWLLRNKQQNAKELVFGDRFC